MSITNEEEIIKKRLLLEGDSGTDDKQINKLVRYFVKWCHHHQQQQQQESNGEKQNGGDEAESCESMYEQLVATFHSIEFSLAKNELILDMNMREQNNYAQLYERIKVEIELAKKRIIESKFELQQARKIRKNRQEYDILAKQILNFPDRAEMQSTIRRLGDKVESLKKVEAEYYKKLDLRRKQFGVLLQALSALKNLIDNDVKLEDLMSNQLSKDQMNFEIEQQQQQQQRREADEEEANKNSLDDSLMDDATLDDEESSRNRREPKREKLEEVATIDAEMADDN